MKEGYMSWWVYVTSQMASGNPDDWGPTFGGWQTWFGPQEGPTYYWWTGGRWGTAGSASAATIRFQFVYGWGKVPDEHDPNGEATDFSSDAEAIEQSWDPQTIEGVSLYFADWVSEWVHLQVYWKIGISDGAVKAWFNGNLVADKEGIATDPRAYSEWNSNPATGTQTVFRSDCPDGAPKIGPELYQGENSYENWIWVDDVVAATEKVPESYKVVEE